MFRRKKETEFNAVERIDQIIREAIDSRTSDIHFEPFDNMFRVRFRIDGVLVRHCILPQGKKEEVTAILKVMAALDTARKREAQDGKIKFPYDRHAVEIRVSVLPVRYGEKVVLRILQAGRVNLDLDGLGISPECLPAFKKAVSARQGLVLVTGSTGSGKTTTIYSALKYTASEELCIVTVEDPIEYEIPGFIQIQMSREINMGWADVLKAVLRQDPDLIVIGEIRDRATAKVALRAALTGHLVIATLHTNDAIDTIIRLTEMGIETYLIAAALKMVTYQRLVRLLCPRCMAETRPDPEHAVLFDLPAGTRVYGPRGCPYCSNTGFIGRRPVFEILFMEDDIVEILARTDKSHKLRNQLKDRSGSVMIDEGRKLILEGLTSCAEVVRQMGC